MFTVLGTTGTLFKGPLEELLRVSRALGVARVRPVDAGRGHSSPNESNGLEIAATATLPAGPHRLGAQAYARVQTPPLERHPLQTVQDVMSTRVTVLSNDTSLHHAWQALIDAGVGQAPVVDAGGRLVGLLTRAELLRLDRLPTPDQAALVWRAWLMRPLVDVMLTPVPAVYAQTDVRRVARVLLDTQLPGLPVTNADDALVGFVSRSDILKAVVHDPPLDLWS